MKNIGTKCIQNISQIRQSLIIDDKSDENFSPILFWGKKHLSFITDDKIFPGMGSVNNDPCRQ